MAKRKIETYIEHPMRPGKRVPPPAGPPAPDPHLGKPTERYISERFVGSIEEEDFDGTVYLKLKGGGKRHLERLIKDIQSHVGFQMELTIYEDSDPDVLFRMGEAVRGVKGGTLTWSGGSVYCGRIQAELEEAFPDRDYKAKLEGETLVVLRVEGGKQQKRFRLASPELGEWILEQWEGKGWVEVDDGLGFVDAVRLLILEDEEPD